MAADSQDISESQCGRSRDALIIHLGSVARTQVFDYISLFGVQCDLAVLSGAHVIIKHYSVFGVASEHNCVLAKDHGFYSTPQEGVNFQATCNSFSAVIISLVIPAVGIQVGH